MLGFVRTEVSTTNSSVATKGLSCASLSTASTDRPTAAQDWRYACHSCLVARTARSPKKLGGTGELNGAWKQYSSLRTPILPKKVSRGMPLVMVRYAGDCLGLQLHWRPLVRPVPHRTGLYRQSGSPETQLIRVPSPRQCPFGIQKPQTKPMAAAFKLNGLSTKRKATISSDVVAGG